MKKKILFILPNLDAGGAERIITVIVNHLDRQKFEPKLVLFKKEGVYLEQLRTDVEIIELDISRIRFSIFKIIPIIRKEKPRIVFSGWGEISALLSILIPFFKNTHFITRETNIVSEHVTRKEIKFFYKFYNNYKTIIAQSDDMLNDLVENMSIKPNKIVKINNPVDFEWIEFKLKQGEGFEFTNPDLKHILAVGNVSYRKGFDNLIKVFSYLKDEPLHLHIVGKGKDMETFKGLVKDLQLQNKITFWGQQSNPYVMMQKADLFVLSSRHEGFPNVLLEAGACGTFTLANNCKGGINEIITKENGIIADIEQHETFSKVLLDCLRIKVDSDKVKESIKFRYEKSIILEKYFELLASVK